MGKKEAFAIVIMLLALSLFYFAFFATQASTGKVTGDKYVDIASNSTNRVYVELAQSAEQKLRGLMFREYLSADGGMLFVYDREDYYSFWMKNTKIPLDIIYISADMRIVDIKHDFQPCTTQDCPAYTPAHAAQYILEVNGGYVEKKNVKIGDEVKLFL